MKNKLLLLTSVSILAIQSCTLRSNKGYLNHPLSTIVYNQSVETIENQMGENIDNLNLRINQLEQKLKSSQAGLCSCQDVQELIDSLRLTAVENENFQNRYEDFATNHVSTIFFEFNSYKLTDAAIKTLMEWVITLKESNYRSENTQIEILTSTDSKGNVAYNRQLRVKRGRTVKDFLVANLSMKSENISIADMTVDEFKTDALKRRAFIRIKL
jgi:outer membrane protein OmpA-like peptidoglycan-associated protein